jgi:polyhydroxyalkanoate synthesis repressor PhaR
MAKPGDSGEKRLEIKKYSNRRYYDATHSRHLTLQEICSLIQQGYDVVVTDGKTGADITAQVLTQIILELETAKLDSFPVPLLVRVIRTNDQLVKDFIEKYFNQALGSFLDYQHQVEEQIRRTHGLPASFPSVSDWTKAMLAPFASALGGSATAPPAETPPPPAAEGGDHELRRMVEHLQRQVAGLKKPTRRPKAGLRRHRRAS